MFLYLLIGSETLSDLYPGSSCLPDPVFLCCRVFDTQHNLSNPGVCSQRRLVSCDFVWTGLSRDVSTWARACLQCQGSTINQHVHAAGSLPSSWCFIYLFNILDRMSCWPKAVSLASITTWDWARDLISVWISRFGFPAKITSDHGAQFISTCIMFPPVHFLFQDHEFLPAVQRPCGTFSSFLEDISMCPAGWS